MSKVVVYVGHDDDFGLGVGGIAAQHVEQGDEVCVVIFTDGRHSHRAVLEFEENPSPWEVKKARKKEAVSALGFLGVKDAYFLDLEDGAGSSWQEEPSVLEEVRRITLLKKPDIVYFHHPDAHPDHHAVSVVVKSTLLGTDYVGKAYQFLIWTKNLAAGRQDVDVSLIPDLPTDAITVDVSQQLVKKRAALFAHKSQVDVWPYEDWQVQPKPILDKSFIDYFLRGEEVIVGCTL